MSDDSEKLIRGLRNDARRDQKRNASGAVLCDCGAELAETDWATCAACTEKRAAEAMADQKRMDRLQLKESVARCLHSFPAWRHADVTHADFSAAVSPEFLSVAQMYKPEHGNLALLGTTGAGKTTTAIAIARRFARAVLDHGPGPKLKLLPEWRMVRGAYFIRAAELIRAIRSFPLGRGDAPELERALGAQFLVLDDVGLEPVGAEGTVFELFAARHARNPDGRVTLITSGFRYEQLEERYDTAFVRRIVEPRGAVFESWEARK